MKRNVHVVRRNGEWAVRKEGAERDSSPSRHASAAIDAARHTAQREGTELLVHGRNGQMRERDSHGHDPYPPKG